MALSTQYVEQLLSEEVYDEYSLIFSPLSTLIEEIHQ
jgi:hypothetical protein